MNYLILLAFLLSGCASFTDPANGQRVTEYSGGIEGGHPIFGGGRIEINGGCQQVSWGEPQGCLEYSSDTCQFRSADCSTTTQETLPEDIGEDYFD